MNEFQKILQQISILWLFFLSSLTMLLAKSLCVRDATKILSQLIVPMVFHFNLCNILRVLLTSLSFSNKTLFCKNISI